MAASRGRMEPPPETSPERTKASKETRPRRVPVVYYLSRNGQLEHPHFMEVTLSSCRGLFLRDVIDRLNFLRGKGMANLYSWSSKRSYKNGFVWQDLVEDDLIHPAHGHEYVLKGSELLLIPVPSSSSLDAKAAFYASNKPLHVSTFVHDDLETLQIRNKRATWSSFDLNEYKVYKTDPVAETGVRAADASTQTDDWRCRQREDAAAGNDRDRAEPPTTELEREDISPPPSSSSPEILEMLIKADGRAVAAGPEDQNRPTESYSGGRLRASSVLMHLLSCGSINVKDRHGISVAAPLPRCTDRASPRGRSSFGGAKETVDLMAGNGSARIGPEDKDHTRRELDRDDEEGTLAVLSSMP
ncbi:unnamed protein product [Musa acuminata subsp. malaccensis]|uniref:(wild Malaysian banana) hypothetical protein n=1 Tax=Musa acuminata subsp. malaccensis TaxID=214687 RepID=A0A804JAD1_MUSAM|nr:PREDICTED: protein UPSTREAM OF FLC-like [Musa acuminata subsp. malaccensis]CAG1840607.1 unnamed protein product [Musa acuminata subsp. malaccensis]